MRWRQTTHVRNTSISDSCGFDCGDAYYVGCCDCGNNSNSKRRTTTAVGVDGGDDDRANDINFDDGHCHGE